MKKTHRSFLVIFSLILICTGCVSQQSFQSVVQQLERERLQNEQLRKEMDQLRTEAAKHKEDSARLAGENQTLLKSAQEDKTKTDELSAQVESLSRDVARFSKKKGGAVVVAKKPDMSWAKGLSDEFQKTFRDEIKKGDAQLKQTQDRLTFVLEEPLLFEPDDVEITKEGEDILVKLGGVLKKANGRQIVVGGHLDDAPIAPSMAKEFPTAWEFTGTRAVSIVRFLEEEDKISGKILTAAAYGATRAVAANSTDSGRAQNRRIEVTLLP
ncbi:MAG: OmpA family protein [Nitrospirae bacterium]|nr:OmpA family protein [Nitrospirota bacterium]